MGALHAGSEPSSPFEVKKKAKYLSGVCAFQVFFIYLQNKLLTINFYKAISQTIFIRPQTRKRTDGIKEKNSYFLCPSNTVLTGRCHSGDENGISEYKFSGLQAIDINGETIKGNITIEDLEWSEWHIQSDSADFFLSTDLEDRSRVLTGRQHTGDENGKTRYQTGIVKFNGKKAKVTHYPDADLVVRENGGLEVLPKDNLVMIGIKHSGDENGLATYCQGYIVIS